MKTNLYKEGDLLNMSTYAAKLLLSITFYIYINPQREHIFALFRHVVTFTYFL